MQGVETAQYESQPSSAQLSSTMQTKLLTDCSTSFTVRKTCEVNLQKVTLIGTKEPFSVPNVYVNLTTEEIITGANKMAENLHKLLSSKEQAGPLPSLLDVQTDNGTCEHKNKGVMGYLPFMVSIRCSKVFSYLLFQLVIRTRT